MADSSSKAVLVYVNRDGSSALVRQFDTMSDMAVFVAEEGLKRGEYVVVEGTIILQRLNEGMLPLDPDCEGEVTALSAYPCAERRSEYLYNIEGEDYYADIN